MNDYNQILKAAQQGIATFLKSMPAVQSSMFSSLLLEVSKLDLDAGGSIKANVANMNRLASIRAKINRVILTDEYKKQVRGVVDTVNDITRLQNQYWRAVESDFKPSALLREIREQTIGETVKKLTESGIGANVSDRVTEVLRTNITGGGSLQALTDQLKDGLLSTEQQGYLERYAGQVVRDAVGQYSAQYSQVVASDLGYTWYVYDNTDIETTRPFCDHMTDQPYFHLCQIPDMLKGKTTTGQVPLYDKTNLPAGMIPGTDASNFLVRRGGYNCGHQCRPVAERQVPPAIRAAVYATPAYEIWARKNGAPQTPPPPPPPPPKAVEPVPPKLNAAAVENIAAAEVFVPLKNKDAAKAYLSNVVSQVAGLPVKGVSVSSELDIAALNRKLEAATNLFKEYNLAYGAAGVPKEGVQLTFKSNDRHLGAVTAARYRDGSIKTIKINFGDQVDNKGNQYDPLQEIGKDADGNPMYEERNLRPFSRVDADKTDISVVTHEFAHVMAIEQHAADPTVRPEVKEFLKELKELRIEYHKELSRLNKAGNYNDLYEYHLGMYAATNLNEFMAEGWTEYKLSSNPSPMAKKIGQLIDKTFKK